MEQFKISRALSLSFKSCFQNVIPLALLMALLYSPLAIWFATFNTASEVTEDLVNKLFTYPIYFTVGVSTLVPPLLTYRVIKELDGTTVSLLTSIKFGVRGCVPAVLLAAFTQLVQQVPGSSIIGAVVTCICFVAAPAAVAEKLGPFAAFSRSAALTKGRRWGIFGLAFLIGVIPVVLLLLWIAPTLEHGAVDSISSLRNYSILVAVIIGVGQTFTGVAQAVSYALLRQDKDGVSHAELARVFE